MDAAFDYCRRIIDDMDFNKSQFKKRLPIRLLAVGGEHSIPNMDKSLQPYFENVTSVVIPNSGHFVPHRQASSGDSSETINTLGILCHTDVSGQRAPSTDDTNNRICADRCGLPDR